jgi:nitroimidazol reductase NimA-like FMN-containing flavoprotein (pyridoxamine 5'-phosphate oxidase superfamily)
MAQPLIAHIAVIRNGKPHVTPIWIHYEHGTFYFTTRLGRVKGRAIQKMSTVAISVATNDRPYKAVIVEGKAENVEAGKWKVLEKIATKYGRAEGLRWLEHSKKEADRVAMMVRPASVLTWDYGKGDYQKQNAGQSMKTNR